MIVMRIVVAIQIFAELKRNARKSENSDCLLQAILPAIGVAGDVIRMTCYW